LVLLVHLFFLFTLFGGVNKNSVEKSLIQLSKAPVKVQYDENLQVPEFIKGQFHFEGVTNLKDLPIQFMNKFKESFQLHPETTLEFFREKTNSLNGDVIYHYQQYVKGIPIFNSDIAFSIMKNGDIRLISGKWYQIDFSLTPSIDKTFAESMVLNDKPTGRIVKRGTPQLTIFDDDGDVRLTYHMEVYTEKPYGEWHYFVDAQTGKIFFKYNNVFDAKNRRIYTANNGTSLPGTLIITEGGSSSDPVAMGTYNNFGTTYDYWLNTHGRDSYNNAGATIVATVHYDVNYVNAYWNGNQFVFGDGDGSQSDPLGLGLDVVAHEFTHAVTQYTANLTYSNQPGALNESMSDVFAAMVDRDDWWIGEDVWTPGTPNDALRYMDDPPRGNQPDHMDNYQDVPYDNGGVHINSGIPNKACYNIATDIGRAKTERIYYYALANLMTSNDDFSMARAHLVEAATQLYGAGSPEVAAVEAGFDAVGITGSSGGGGGGCKGKNQLVTAPLAEVKSIIRILSEPYLSNKSKTDELLALIERNQDEFIRIFSNNRDLLTEANDLIVKYRDFFTNQISDNPPVFSENMVYEFTDLLAKVEKKAVSSTRQDLNTLAILLENAPGKTLSEVIAFAYQMNVLSTDDENPYALNQFEFVRNYPNPFNPATSIQYRVAQRGKVTIHIYDITGRLIRTLVNEVKNPGLYSIRFDASNLPSGIYIYRLRTPKSDISKKMILVK
jgi:thermolysin